MAGSFGYEREHYDVSMEVGRERLFEVIASDPESEIAAAGTFLPTSDRRRHGTQGPALGRGPGRRPALREGREMAFNIKERGRLTYYYGGDHPTLSALVSEKLHGGALKIYFAGLTGGALRPRHSRAGPSGQHAAGPGGGAGLPVLGEVAAGGRDL